jgi:hypothetical protein
MTVTRAIAATAMLAGLAVGTASSAWADTTMSGHYIETITTPSGKTMTHDWYITPCGEGCADIQLPIEPGRAHLVNGQWTMDGDDDTTCADGTSFPNGLTAHYAWDPNTLAGTLQATTKTALCGFPQGYTYSNAIQLTKAP